MKPVAICISNMNRDRKDADFWKSWYDFLEKNEIPWEFLDCYCFDIINKLDNYSALLWHYSNFSNADLMEAQNIIDIAEKKGLKVFPNRDTAWHYDDKIAEMYELERVGAPIPPSYVFYNRIVCEKWLEENANYPLVAKLRRGSGSNNVRLLKSQRAAVSYCHRMFGKGISPAQSLVYKTYSKLQSTKNIKMLMERAKKIPRWLIARRFSKGMPVESGYCYFQEFIQNDGYDIKVVVVGDKCSFLTRDVRKGSFKASGGGDIKYNRQSVPDNVIKTAFEVADKIGSQCMGFDFVVDNDTNKGLIIEMCFGFDFDAIKQCGGYYDRNLEWHNEPLDTLREIINNLNLL